MATRFRRKKIRAAGISDPIRAAYVMMYISPAFKLGPPECDIERLRTFFYKVCEMITVDANFIDATEILNDMKLALLTHVDYYKKQEYTDFQRILAAIEEKIIPTIQAQNSTFDVVDLQADIGYIQLTMKEIYIASPTISDGSNDSASKCGSEKSSDHSSERAMQEYTHQSSHMVSRMILKVLQSIIRSINLPDVIEYTTTFITYIENAYHSNEYLERLQDKLISMIGNINHGVSPGIIKMRVEYIKDMLDNCVQS